MKFKRLASKMIVYISAIVLIVCIGLAVISYTTASKALTTATEDSLEQIAANGAQKISERLSTYFSELNGLANVAAFQDIKANKEEIIALMNRVTKSSGHIKMFVSDTAGITYNIQGQSTTITDREYSSKP